MTGRRFNDLESGGFEKYLAFAYGIHIITGIPLLHSIGLESGGGTGQEGVLLSALGDGAYNEEGEGAWGVCSTAPSGSCSPEELAPIDWDVLTNITETSGELVKTGGSAGTYDAHAYSPSFSGDHCFDIEWEVTELKHTQRLFVVVQEVDGTEVPPLDSSANGWFMTTQFGDNPFFAQILDGTPETLLSYEFPFGFHIHGNGDGTGILHANVGGIPADHDWSGALSDTFTYDDTQAQRIHVGIAGFDSDPVATAALIKLAAGLGSPLAICNAPKRVLYSGFDIPIETNVHYHPGTISKGDNDPIQGVDPWFPGGSTYSATPNIAVLLPDGIDEDVDGSKLAIIIETSAVADYDSSGNLISIGYSSNPARVKADALKRHGQHNRIVWSSYIHARDYYDELLDWEAGDTTNTYISFTGVPTYDKSGNIDVTVLTGALSKPIPTDADDNQAITQERILATFSGYYKFTIDAAFPTFTGGGAVYLVDDTGKGWYGLAWGNGHYSHFANGVPIDKNEEPYLYPGTVGDVNEIGVDGSGNFYWKKNNTLMSIPQGVAPAPFDKDLFAKVILWEGTASISSSEISGKQTNTTTNNVTQVKRFEAHPAFTSPVDLGTLLDYVDLLCASDTQEAGRDIIFLTPEPRTPVHDFDEDTNVIGDIRVHDVDIRERPNRLWCTFRNLDTQFLEKDSEFDLREDLFNRLGRTIDPGAYNFAGMSGSQAQRLIKHRMRIDSDNFRWCDLKGDHTSIKVLPAHVVRVISREYKVEVDTGGFDGADTTISLKPDESANFRLEEMEIPFYATVWNFTDYSHPRNDPDREIIQITDVTGDDLTIVRGQLGTSAVAHNTVGKTYVIGRIPKRFKVIEASRESAESTALTRDFVLQEYYPDDYRDTDHRPRVNVVNPPTPSPFDCPPNPVIELVQKSTDSVGGTITKIVGTIHFGTYAFAQKAKIFITKEGESEVDTGLIVEPAPGTTTGTFEWTAEEATTYTIRVQVISGANKPCGSVSKDISIGDTIVEDDSGLFIVEDGTGLPILEDS